MAKKFSEMCRDKAAYLKDLFAETYFKDIIYHKTAKKTPASSGSGMNLQMKMPGMKTC